MERGDPNVYSSWGLLTWMPAARAMLLPTGVLACGLEGGGSQEQRAGRAHYPAGTMKGGLAADTPRKPRVLTLSEAEAAVPGSLTAAPGPAHLPVLPPANRPAQPREEGTRQRQDLGPREEPWTLSPPEPPPQAWPFPAGVDAEGRAASQGQQSSLGVGGLWAEPCRVGSVLQLEGRPGRGTDMGMACVPVVA